MGKIDDDKNLIVKGTRVYETETTKSKSKFKQMFSLDKSVDVDRFSATMTNGVLVVTAPKRNQQLLKDSRKIPIVCVDDGAVAVTEHKNLENKQSKDDVESKGSTEEKSSKDDSFKNVDQGNGEKVLNSEDNGTQQKDEKHDDNIMKVESHASKHSAEKKSEENTNESAK